MTESNVTPADEVMAQARQLAVDIVHGGFADFEDAVEAVVEHFADEYAEHDAGDARGDDGSGGGGDGADRAREIVAAVWSARLAEQREWPRVTEAERLLQVFEALTERDIVAEPNFTCCGRCGMAEIGAETTPDSRGFVFFHQQDTDAAVRGDGLMLAFGGFDDSAETTATVGREVADALTAAGLTVAWDGSPGQRLHVTPLRWRIRLTEPVG